MTVPEPCLQRDDKPPTYPVDEVQFEDCQGRGCLSDDGLRAFIQWRDAALQWMSNTDTQCRARETPEDDRPVEAD